MLDFFVNRHRFKTLNQSVSSGERVRLDWVKEVELRDDQALQFTISGKDVDLLSDDSLGEVRASYSKDSSPAWGLGTHTLCSSNGSFDITVAIESVKVDF